MEWTSLEWTELAGSPLELRQMGRPTVEFRGLVIGQVGSRNLGQVELAGSPLEQPRLVGICLDDT